jgi:hypothetical protein
MLLRLGRKEEGAALYDLFKQTNLRAKSIPVSIPMATASPSSMQESAYSTSSSGQPNDDRNYESKLNDSGGDSSCKDPRTTEQPLETKNHTNV